MKFKKRHSASEINIYTEIALLAEKYNAINLSQGSPDFLPNPQLKEFLIEAMDQNLYQYASISELPILTENIIRYNSKRKLPINLSDNQIVVIPGATYGIHLALATFLEPGDEVIVLEPCYETYAPAIEIKGAIPVYFTMMSNPEYSLDWELLRKCINPKTKAIIVNTPNNPTGKIWTKNDWDLLWDIIKDTEIVVVSDEVYDSICYDDHLFYSANHHPEIKNRAFSIFSFEKMFHICGWKACYVIGPEDYIRAFQDIHQYLSFNINVYSQYAMARYLEVYTPEKHREIYQKKRDLLYNSIQDLPFEISKKAEGGYFQCLGFKKIKPDMSDLEFSKWLIQEMKVASIPYSAFYNNHKNTGKIRLCFAKKDETLVQAIENLRKI